MSRRWVYVTRDAAAVVACVGFYAGATGLVALPFAPAIGAPLAVGGALAVAAGLTFVVWSAHKYGA